MKQIKRLISLLTVAAVIIGCLGSFAAYAAGGSSRVGAYDPEKRLTALGFMDEGDIDAAAEKMSRAMFVRTAVRIYMASSNIPSWGAQTFRDVTADSLGAAEIQLAANSGLIDSTELFYPDEPISYSDAEKILVRVLGYEPMAERSGYMAAATSAKVFRGVNAAFLMKDALKALDNALECPRMKGVTYGSGTRYETSDTDTLLLRAGFDKKSVTITEIDVANSSITADGVTYKTENVDLGAIPEGTAYIYIRESDDVVVFVETRGETELLYDFIEFPSPVLGNYTKRTGGVFVTPDAVRRLRRTRRPALPRSTVPARQTAPAAGPVLPLLQPPGPLHGAAPSTGTGRVLPDRRRTGCGRFPALAGTAPGQGCSAATVLPAPATPLRWGPPGASWSCSP